MYRYFLNVDKKYKNEIGGRWMFSLFLCGALLQRKDNFFEYPKIFCVLFENLFGQVSKVLFEKNIQKL